MDPSCGSWIAHPSEHVGRGTPAISGGAVFFSFWHFTEFKGFSVQGMLIFRWSWVQIPRGAQFFGHRFKPTEGTSFKILIFKNIHIVTKCRNGSKPLNNRKECNLTWWKYGGHGYFPQRRGVCAQGFTYSKGSLRTCFSGEHGWKN